MSSGLSTPLVWPEAEITVCHWKSSPAPPRPDSAGHQPRVRGSLLTWSLVDPPHYSLYIVLIGTFLAQNPTPPFLTFCPIHPKISQSGYPRIWRPRLLRHLVISATGPGISRDPEAKENVKSERKVKCKIDEDPERFWEIWKKAHFPISPKSPKNPKIGLGATIISTPNIAF